MEQAIKKAIEGGYEPEGFDLDVLRNIEENDMWLAIGVRSTFLLDPLFWQSLGKAIASEKKGIPTVRNGATYMQHDFINHLAEGKSVDEFFKDLLK